MLKRVSLSFTAWIFEYFSATFYFLGEISSKVFHHYVQPTEEPYLSEFCTNLTGITQDKVDQGAPLGTTLLMFNKWLRNNFGHLIFNAKDDKNCAVVTWTDW